MDEGGSHNIHRYEAAYLRILQSRVSAAENEFQTFFIWEPNQIRKALQRSQRLTRSSTTSFRGLDASIKYHDSENIQISPSDAQEGSRLMPNLFHAAQFRGFTSLSSEECCPMCGMLHIFPFVYVWRDGKNTHGLRVPMPFSVTQGA